MRKNKKFFCVQFIMFICMTGFLGLTLMPASGNCTTGTTSPTPTGTEIVKKHIPVTSRSVQAKLIMKTYTVRPGDVLSDILVKYGLSRKDALYVSKKSGSTFKLTKMRPGSNLELYFLSDGSGLQEVDFKPTSLKKVILYNGRVIKLTSSKSQDAPLELKKEADTPNNKSLKTVLNNTDSLKCIKYDRKILNKHLANSIAIPGSHLHTNKKTSINKTLARTDTSKLQNTKALDFKRTLAHNKTMRSKKGKSMRVAKKTNEPVFLNAPLKYRRVSSGFSYSRIDPFTNEAQPHLGVDFSAPTGTPVYSIGAGRLEYIGWDGGYGKTIRVIHPNGFMTQYAHLSHFAKSMIRGKRIRKGEVIGYVGMTGLSTGPHLDFRISHRGTYINPLNLEASLKKLSPNKFANKAHHAPNG